MNKPPAFQMYASDFLVDINDWTVDEVGIYLRLLLSEWVNGELPNDEKRLARIAGCSYQKFKKRWFKVECKFEIKNNGFLINKRMEIEREKQDNYRKLQAEKGKLGGRPQKSRSFSGVLTEQKPNKSSSSSSSSSSLKIKDYSPTSLEVRLSKFLFSFIKKRDPKAKKPNYQKWGSYIDKLIRIDKRTPEEIEAIIEWCQNDSFWQDNILSTEKLREKFTQLKLKKDKTEECPYGIYENGKRVIWKPDE